MKTIQLILATFLLSFGWQNSNSQEGERLPTIKIDSVKSMGIPNQPQMFSVYGSVTLTAERRRDVNSVVIFTKSGLGGNIQLQQTEAGPSKKKIAKSIVLDEFILDESAGIYRWEIDGIWLGKPNLNDGVYEVYAIIVKTRSADDVNQLLNISDLFLNRNDLLKELKRRNLEPVVTFKKVERIDH